MKTRIALLTLTIVLFFLLSGCDWQETWDAIFNPAFRGPGSPIIIIENGLPELATKRAGGRDLSAQLTAIAGTQVPNDSVLGILERVIK